MKHMVITIGCEYGAGGPEIGKMLAKALGIEYYDRDLVDKIINDLDVDKELVEKADKGTNVPLYLRDDTRSALREPDEQGHLPAIPSHAQDGRSIILRHHRPQRQLSAAG